MKNRIFARLQKKANYDVLKQLVDNGKITEKEIIDVFKEEAKKWAENYIDVFDSDDYTDAETLMDEFIDNGGYDTMSAFEKIFSENENIDEEVFNRLTKTDIEDIVFYVVEKYVYENKSILDYFKKVAIEIEEV